MSDIVIKATVTNPDGSTFWQENGWTQVPPEATNIYLEELKKQSEHAERSNNKGGPYNAVLECSIDGVASPPQNLVGITDRDYNAFLREADQFGKDLRKEQEKFPRHGHGPGGSKE